MITVVVVKNPFEPWNSREIQKIEYAGNVGNLAKLYDFGTPNRYTLNGFSVDYETPVKDGDFVVLYPEVAKGGKSILGIVAVVALGVVSMGAGAAVAGVSSLGAATGWAAVGGWLTAAGIMFVGNSLIGRFMGVKPDTGRYDYENNPTYSWGDVQTMEGQNNAIALTYGKVKSAGQTIGKYINVENDKEYLNWLVSAGEGPLNITDIKLNDNSLDFYEGIVSEVREGTNEQEVISNFNDTYFTKSLGYQLLETERIDRAQGNATEGLIVKVEFSNGLYYAEDNGSLGEAWVQLSCQYRLAGSSAWTTMPGSTARISGSQSSAIRKEFRVDGLPAGEYEVKMAVAARSHEVTSSRASTRCWWTALTSVVYDDFSYPCTALIGLKAMATDQISGSPSLSFIKERRSVLVWDPHMEDYVTRSANNPAWASYDMLHMGRFLQNINTGMAVPEYRGVRKELLVYDQFKEWADFCDEKNLHVNVEINTTGELLDVINQNIANCGRGMVVRFGTRFGCVFDCAKQPTQMFGMGNIKAGTFHEEFLPTKDRANCVEVTYTDAENDYSRQTITIYGEDYDSSAEEKIAQVTYNGITSYEQAYREGMYQLYCNKYQLRTVTFEADIDSIACTIGDVVLVAHDVPKWAHSGRIAEVAGQVLTLPIHLDSTAGSYRIMYRTVDDMLYTSNVSIQENGDDYCKVWVSTTFTNKSRPQKNDIFDLALVNMGSKPFIVKAISRAQDFTRKIECLEYNEALYNEDYDVPPIQYTPEGDVAQNVTGLNASQVTYTAKDGRKQSRLYVSWEMPPNGGLFIILLSDDGGKNYRVLRSNTHDTHLKEDVPAYTVYWVKVITILGASQSTGTIEGPIPVGDDSLPPDVLDLNLEVLADNTRMYRWRFNYPDPNDIAGFKFKYIQGLQPNWNKGYEVQEGLVVSQPFETKTIRQGSHIVMVKAVDNSGQESKNYAAVLVDFGDPLEDNVLQKVDFSEGLWESVETNGVKNQFDGFIHAKQASMAYKSPDAYYYGAAEEYFYNEYYQDFFMNAEVTALAGGNFYLIFDIDGISNITYRIKNKESDFKPYSTKFKVKPGDVVQFRLECQEGNKDTVVKKLIAMIDVPDRTEHFKNLSIPAGGVELPIKTPNYRTVGVSIESTPIVNGNMVLPVMMSREPCRIKILNSQGQAISTRADIAWQGFTDERS